MLTAATCTCILTRAQGWRGIQRKSRDRHPYEHHGELTTEISGFAVLNRASSLRCAVGFAGKHTPTHRPQQNSKTFAMKFARWAQAMLPWLGDPVIQRLDQKIEELTGMGPHFAEGIQVSLRRLRWGPLTELHAFVRSACFTPAGCEVRDWSAIQATLGQSRRYVTTHVRFYLTLAIASRASERHRCRIGLRS